MEKRYDIDVEADVFGDRANNLVANYMRYIIKNNIDDENDLDNPVVINYNAAYALMESAYRFKTYAEIDEAEIKLDELWRFYDELGQ